MGDIIINGGRYFLILVQNTVSLASQCDSCARQGKARQGSTVHTLGRAQPTECTEYGLGGHRHDQAWFTSFLPTGKPGRWRLMKPSERTTMSRGSGGPGIADLHICQGQRSAVASKARGCPLNLRTQIFPCELNTVHPNPQLECAEAKRQLHMYNYICI